MKTVFLVIPHYVFTSDLLRTEYVKYLAQKYRVVVFTPFLGEEEAKKGNYFPSPNMTYVKWNLENPKFWKVFKLLRISLVGEFDYLSAMQYFYQRPNFLLHKKRRVLRFLGRPFSKILTVNFFTALEKFLLPRSKKFLGYLEKYNPDLLVTATPGLKPVESEMIILAKKAGLATAAVNFTWDNLTTAAKFIRKTDYLIAWNDISKKEATDIHKYSPNKVFVAGVPRFDNYFIESPGELSRDDFLRSKNLDPKLKTLLFASKPKLYIEQLDHLRELIKARASGGLAQPVNILVRPHPLDEPEFYKEFADTTNLYVDQPAKRTSFDPLHEDKMEMDYGDLMNLKHTLKYCDVQVQYGSTLAIEAALFDRAVVNIGFLKTMAHDKSYQTTHFWPIIESGAAPLAKNFGELIEWINRYLRDPALDREKRARVAQEYVPFRDGLDYKRNVDFLEKILNG